jgi:hypothetical protein
MQKYSDNLDQEERRIARRWTLGALGIYGPILAALILYAAFHQSPDVNLASGESDSTFSVANAPRKQTSEKPANATQRRSCNQLSC